ARRGLRRWAPGDGLVRRSLQLLQDPGEGIFVGEHGVTDVQAGVGLPGGLLLRRELTPVEARTVLRAEIPDEQPVAATGDAEVPPGAIGVGEHEVAAAS